MKNPIKYIGKEREYLEKVLKSENWSSTSGNWTSRLEHQFARKFKAQYAIAFNSGTGTLHAALDAVGIRTGDEVITSPITVISNADVILAQNAIPVFADIDPDTFCLSPEALKRLISKKTKCVVTVHWCGNVGDLDQIQKMILGHGKVS